MIVLKYHKLVNSQDHPAYVSNNTLGKIFGIDGSSVRRLCLKRFGELKDTKILTRKQRLKQQSIPIRKRYGLRFLTSEHKDFLLDPKTLQDWIGRSLKERCILFHRHFGNHRINPTLLRKVYKMHGIKRKKIKWVKRINSEKETEYEQWRLDLKLKLAEFRRNHYRIIFLDETIFTTKTIRRFEYTEKRKPLCVPQVLLQ